MRHSFSRQDQTIWCASLVTIDDTWSPRRRCVVRGQKETGVITANIAVLVITTQSTFLHIHPSPAPPPPFDTPSPHPSPPFQCEQEVKIDLARESYRSAAIRASLAYFVLDDMSRVDPMYQYSLDAYVDLFNLSIDSSRDPNAGEHIGER
jgi:hypothetical protein